MCWLIVSSIRERAILKTIDIAAENQIRFVSGGSGCNMGIWVSHVLTNRFLIDEAFPLYGWLEDSDFSQRLSRDGWSVKASQLRGVHFDIKSGRTSEYSLSYRQIANRRYLCRKGTMQSQIALGQIGANICKNVIRLLCPEPWTDRKGRLRDNILGMVDLLAGRLDPRRILSIHE